MLREWTVAMVSLATLVACSKRDSAAARSGEVTEGSASVPNFELVCSASKTSLNTKLFCMRHDTRTGDVRRVVIEALPVSRGPTVAAEAPAGTYELVCESTQSDVSSDVYCIRLNTVTGEMLLVALPKVGLAPEGAQLPDTESAVAAPASPQLSPAVPPAFAGPPPVAAPPQVTPTPKGAAGPERSQP